MYNYSCEYIIYEPNECCKCYLLGYNPSCNGKECREAKEENEKSNRVSNQAYI